MKLLKISKLQIAQVGAGRFGRFHLDDWKKLAKVHQVDFKGVLVRNAAKRKMVEETYVVPTFSAVTPNFLRSLDGIDIVTPPSTHFALVKRCLPFTNVFVEKPLTLSRKQTEELVSLANKFQHILFVGHIYRFNNAVVALRALIQKEKSKGNEPFFVELNFFDYVEKPTDDCGILFSDLHCFDIIDFLIGVPPLSVDGITTKYRPERRHEDDAHVVFHYPNKLQVAIKLTWNGLPKTRTVDVFFRDKKIHTNLAEQTISVEEQTVGRCKMLRCFREMPLMTELKHFLNVLAAKPAAVSYPDGATALRIQRVVEYIYQSAKAHRRIKIQKV